MGHKKNVERLKQWFRTTNKKAKERKIKMIDKKKAGPNPKKNKIPTD